jgi:uncharacterized protein YggT (Ycf19 family)
MSDYERTTVRDTVEDTTTPGTVAPGTVAPGTAAGVSRTTERSTIDTGPSGNDLARRVVTLLFGILQAFLILRIVLLLLVANRSNDVVQFILSITNPFVEPFRGMFALERISDSGTGSVLDVGAIVALIAWTLIELLILAIVGLGSRRGARTV